MSYHRLKSWLDAKLATSHYLSWCWPKPLSQYGVTRQHLKKKITTDILVRCIVSEKRCMESCLSSHISNIDNILWFILCVYMLLYIYIFIPKLIYSANLYISKTNTYAIQNKAIRVDPRSWFLFECNPSPSQTLGTGFNFVYTMQNKKWPW